MRKTISILLLLAQFSCSKSKPEGVILKVHFQPEKTYCITSIRSTQTVITYSGQDIAMRKLKSMHVKNPTTSKVGTKTDVELVTGKKSTGSDFQVNLTYKRSLSLDGKNEIPEGTVLHGEIDDGHQLVFHSVTSGTLDLDQKAQLLQDVRKTFEQFDFKEQRLKIGEQFSVDRPVSLPMDGSVIETTITTNYKLIGIKNGMAQFELVQTYQMNPKMMDNSFNGKGSGKGQLTFDIENCLISNYSMKTELIMNKKLDYFEFDLKTVNEFSQTTRIG